jgi:hypothetical protein
MLRAVFLEAMCSHDLEILSDSNIHTENIRPLSIQPSSCTRPVGGGGSLQRVILSHSNSNESKSEGCFSDSCGNLVHRRKSFKNVTAFTHILHTISCLWGSSVSIVTRLRDGQPSFDSQ